MNLESGDEYNIVVTSRLRGTVPTALWNSSYFVFVNETTRRFEGPHATPAEVSAIRPL